MQQFRLVDDCLRLSGLPKRRHDTMILLVTLVRNPRLPERDYSKNRRMPIKLDTTRGGASPAPLSQALCDNSSSDGARTEIPLKRRSRRKALDALAPCGRTSTHSPCRLANS